MQEQFISKMSKFMENFNASIRSYAEAISQSMKRLPPRIQSALKVLGEHGWFLDSEMPMPGLWELEEVINTGNVEEAEKALVDYFKKRISEIEKNLCSRFPKRAKIIQAAFKAHSRGEYELSIPVFLIQADGICYEMIGIQLFKKRNHIPATAAYVKRFANDTFSTAILCTLSLALPISASENERGKEFNDLNRHQVLHGESTSYGSEVNSLKAVSLLNYLDMASKIIKDLEAESL